MTPTRSQGVPEIAALTSIRGIAACWVVLLHFWPVLAGLLPETAPARPLLTSGMFAVPLFFVLSGYVLGLRYGQTLSSPSRPDLLRFWWMRLGRVYPVHVATLAVDVALVSWNGWPTDPAHSIASLAANVALIQAWAMKFQLTWNYPAWSISSEWFAYLLFPLAAAVVHRCRRPQRLTLLALACVASSVVYFFEQGLPFQALVVVIPTFLGGVLLSQLWAPGSVSVDRRWADVIGFVALALPFVVASAPLRGALYLPVFFALVMLLGANERVSMFWKQGAIVFLGEVSYSLYMTHAITIKLLIRFLAPSQFHDGTLLTRLAITGVCLGAIGAVAVAMYFVVDQPLRRAARRLASQRTVTSRIALRPI